MAARCRLFGYSPVVPSRYGNPASLMVIFHEQMRSPSCPAGSDCSILPLRIGRAAGNRGRRRLRGGEAGIDGEEAIFKRMTPAIADKREYARRYD